MNHVDAVVFDIGRVLIDFSFERAFQLAGAHAGLSSREVRARLFGESDFAGKDHERDVVDYECGRIDSRQFHARVEHHLGCTMPYDRFCSAWNSIFTAEITDTLEILENLRRHPRIKTGVLSNTNELHFDYLRERMPVFDAMSHVFVSHRVGMRKPNTEIYKHVLREMNVPAERTVFVDDLPDNIAAAEKLGMLVVHAKGPESVRAGLAQWGLA